MRALYVVLLLALAVPTWAATRPAIVVGPAGSIQVTDSHGAALVTDLAVSAIAPGWSGSLLDQAGQSAARPIDGPNGTRTWRITLRSGATAADLVQVVTPTPSGYDIGWTFVPRQTMQVECLAVQARLPVAIHSGRTRYLYGSPQPASGLLPASLPPAGHVIVGGRTVDWVALLPKAGTPLKLSPRGLSVQLQDNRKWDIADFTLLLTTPGGTLGAGKPIRFGLRIETGDRAALEAEADRLSRNDMTRLRLGDGRRLRVGEVTADRATVPAYGHLEIRADVAATYTNPYDPDQVAIDAIITRPGGGSVRVPAFYMAPARLVSTDSSESVVRAGTPGFRVRYTPVRPGRYSVVIEARDRTGFVRSHPITFRATPARSAGFVRRSPRIPGMFQTEEGKPFICIGENLCWSSSPTPVAHYRDWLAGLGSSGANWVRLWMAYNEKGLEWCPAPAPQPGTGAYGGLGIYAQDNAFRMDRIVQMASAAGVRLMFCLGTYGEFTEGGYFGEGCWASNPYNARNGGPCRTPAEFWTNPAARSAYRKRIRYLVARWGYSPNLFAWEFWNEVPQSPDTDRWLAEMAAEFKRVDVNRHLVSTTYGAPSTWKIPGFDFAMQHMYGQAGNTADFTDRIVSEARTGMASGKPYLLAEFGIDWQTSDRRWDPRGTGVSMHNGAWASLMSGAAGTAMLWYWDDYVHPANLYRTFAPVRAFAASVDWLSAPMSPLAGVRASFAPGTPVTFSDWTIPGTVEWGSTPSNTYTLREDGDVDGGPVAMTVGSPHRANPRELNQEISWRLNLRQPTTVTLTLGMVSNHARLQVLLDGLVKIDRDLPTGAPGTGPWKDSKYLTQYGIWQSDYAEPIPLELPAGAHRITVRCPEGDWLQIRSIQVPAYRSSIRPDVNTVALAGGKQALLWLHNRQSSWKTDYDGGTPGRLDQLRISLPVARGAWRVAWWDTWTGKVIRRQELVAGPAGLALVAPTFSRDLAVHCVRTR